VSIETVSPHFGKRDILTLRCVSTHEMFSPEASKLDFENDNASALRLAASCSQLQTDAMVATPSGPHSYVLTAHEYFPNVSLIV
jgi:hypothetical protein